MNLLLQQITSFYLKSRDFNGIPLSTLAEKKDRDALLLDIGDLVRQELVSVVFGDGHPNPHIRALPEHHTPEKQVELLGSDMWDRACVYPLRRHLESVVDPAHYAGRPYALALALGEPQLTHHAFDLTVLEPYRNDPCYSFFTDDIYGSISVRERQEDAGRLSEHDEVFLQSFGFAYDEPLNKYVAVFTWDLFKLTPQHQQLWQSKETQNKTFLHPDYYRTQVLGDWPEKVSIYEAFIEELQTINRMSEAMGRPPLFREDFKTSNRPSEFFSLLRPTARDFSHFVLLLDKLLSDNINKDFFLGEVRTEDETQRSDGRVQVQPRGTIAMLEDWIHQKFKPKDPDPIKELFASLRAVRKLRQKPAHAVEDNHFDQSFVHEQRALMVRAYNAIRVIRLILANHPATRGIEVSEHLFKGHIWSK
jgi:hypothetical protein